MAYTTPLLPYSKGIKNLELLDAANGQKVVKNVNCKYAGSITDGTLLINVCNVLENYLSPTGEMSIGKISDEEYICEYPRESATGSSIDVVTYNSVSGTIRGCNYDSLSDSYKQLKLADYSEAAVGAMLPVLLEDEEFNEAFEWLKDNLKDSISKPTDDLVLHYVGLACENYYRRIKSGMVVTNLSAGGNITKLNRAQVDGGHLNPEHVIVEGKAGWKVVTASSASSTTPGKKGSSIPHENFIGKYIFDETRELTEEEKFLVPELPEYYVIPEEAVKICEHAKITHGLPCRMANFLLRGPAGTGKTSIAQAIASGFGLPYVKYTCSAGTEVFDLIGQIFPAIDNKGNITENFSALLDEIVYTPEEAYVSITGAEKEDATTQDCVKAIFAKLEKTGNDSGSSFIYQMTDLLKAIKYGWVVEIQEPATIVMAGVLVALNSLLEKEGSITLPTEEIITRHPDAIVVATTNVTYEGCRHMNQSFLDRMDMILDVELPEKDVICERVMRLTGASEEAEVEIRKMIDVVNRIAEKCNKEAITDGVTGIRALTGWVVSTFVTSSPYLSALDTVISKATEDPDVREDLIATCLEPVFSKGYKVVLK